MNDETAEMIYVASDHAGLVLKGELAKHLREAGYQVQDLGAHTPDSVDYPDFADRLASAMREDPQSRGVLVCGTGIGIGIAANRHRHIRAALCRDVTDARLTRLHNDANVIALGERTTGIEVAKQTLDAFLETDFEGGRHMRRVEKMS